MRISVILQMLVTQMPIVKTDVLDTHVTVTPVSKRKAENVSHSRKKNMYPRIHTQHLIRTQVLLLKPQRRKQLQKNTRPRLQQLHLRQLQQQLPLLLQQPQHLRRPQHRRRPQHQLRQQRHQQQAQQLP